mgnify:CR=1 FL=1
MNDNPFPDFSDKNIYSGELVYDPAFPENDPLMCIHDFNGRLYVFHRDSVWVSVKCSWWKWAWLKSKSFFKNLSKPLALPPMLW